jgi:RNA polymerase sigma-70 factor, ECF subfamily
MSMSGDSGLLRAAKKLDQGALAAIFDQFAPAIYKYCLRLSGNPAEADDIVGEVFEQLINQLAKGKGPRDNLRSYLYQIAYHRVVDYSRERRNISALDGSMPSGPGDLPAAQQEGQEMLNALEVAIRTELTEDQRHIVVLRYMENFNLKETAEITGKDIGNVKVIQSRAVAKLRQILSLQFKED